MKIRASAQKVIRMLEESGFEAYMVGGAVRDLLLNRPIRDIDICTSATVEQIKSLFPKHADIGGEHGTLLVHQEEDSFEVSQFKGDPASKSQERSIMTDLKYRDFSCNAIAMRGNGEIIDPFHGQQAIKEKKIQLVNNDPARFIDDPLRILRGIRLALELGFEIDEKTEKWMKEHAEHIQRPAKERIAQEFEKLFARPVSKRQLEFLLNNKVVKELDGLFPERQQLLEGLSKLPSSFYMEGIQNFWVTASYSTNLTETKNVLKMYKQSRKIIKYSVKVVEHVLLYKTEGDFNNVHLYCLGKDGIEGACILLSLLLGKEMPILQYDKRYQELPIHHVKELAITGSDLITWFPQQSGKWIGEMLNKIEKQVVLKKLNNDKEEIYDWIKRELTQ